MRNLLHATDRDRLAGLLRGPLRREVALGGQPMTALAEADSPEGGGLCAAPANARAAELLVQPEIRDADPGFTDAVLDFVMAMAEQPMPCRRVAAGGIEVLRDDPRDFEVLTPFHRYTGDLSAGLVRQQLRGAGENPPTILHSGNMVEFRIGRHRGVADAEDTIRDFALHRRGDDVVLTHESRIRGKAGLLMAREVEAGTLRYDYEIAAGSPLLRVTVTLTAAGQKLSRVRLSTAADQLGAGGLRLATGRIEAGGSWREVTPAATKGVIAWAENTPVSHLAAGTEAWPEGAPALHLRPAAPAQVMSVRATTETPGALHWLLLRHGPSDLMPGAALVVREDRLLAAGTGAEPAARAMTAPASPGLDLDPMPPEGATLNAVATQLLLATTYRKPFEPARRAMLEAWLDRQLAALAAGNPALVDLAYAVLAAEARLRARGGEAGELGALAGRLLALQAPAGGFREPGGAAAPLASHAVAILALARALAHLDPTPIAAALGSALAAVRPGPVNYLDGSSPAKLEALALEGGATAQLRRHAETIGLLARATGTVVLAGEAWPGSLPAEVSAQARELHRVAIALVRPLVRPRGTALEVLPSPLGGAPNPAGQAAVALGLLAPDLAILKLGVTA